ncbi:MAG: hypothetical protein M3680_14260 [Myxococcota bacterium]|nr:hypothetical protein [Myxococcota bacterium]
MTRISLFAVAFACLTVGCATDEDEPEISLLDDDEADVQAAEAEGEWRAIVTKQAVVDKIRDVAARRGITNPMLVAGIAYAETNLAHCRADYIVQQCRQSSGTPTSASCRGGSVLVGNADPSCDQGGLGLFQLDAGTQRQTIARYGRRVLEIEGNIDLGITHILEDLWRCSLTPSWGSDRDLALARARTWLNNATRGSAAYGTFFMCMSRHYNGAGTQAQANYYRERTEEVFARYGGRGGHPGTVNTSGAPLSIRERTTTNSAVIGTLADGTAISIRCQKRGQSVTGTYGTSDLWDDIGNGFVADAFIRTGSDGQVAPTCP